MSIFHYKAVFLNQTEQDVFYKYCPDTIEQKNLGENLSLILKNGNRLLLFAPNRKKKL